ncbi:unnamed protein product [Vicia faba]|uniref:Cobalamin-independent methionine synthase MetE C-terminal/archaeal domain-containing protein n=1 Tax=Vicia faba TaxID=3906 RepID=A0AAV1AEE1_VICFA|nr:unnamed protein product [Vicia faba]
MDANVITIENSISDEKLLYLFREEVIYITGIGPGVYSIHSPRIPPTEEICLSDFLSRVDVVNNHPWTPESRLVTGVLKFKKIYYTFRKNYLMCILRVAYHGRNLKDVVITALIKFKYLYCNIINLFECPSRECLEKSILGAAATNDDAIKIGSPPV